MNRESLAVFVWKQKRNRRYLLTALLLAIAQFIVFKLLYPFPDCFNDSKWYIYAAQYGWEINVWPIGYSKFLLFIHFLSHSSQFLVAFQFFFLQLAALYFYFTLLYFLRPSRLACIILFIFLFLNPLNLYLANTVATDTLFGALTLLWLTELIWIIQRPQLYQIFTQAIILFCCFTLRNTTYYYPLIMLFAFILSSQKLWHKLVGLTLPIFLVSIFVIHTRNVAHSITGTYQSSLLSGWQMGNNALYIYNHITIDSTKFPTPESREINRLATHFFKTVDLRRFYHSFDANVYIVVDSSPLKQYFQKHLSETPGLYPTLISWGKASAAIAPFGKTIILNHPLEYLRYFVLPNIDNYLYPPLCDLKAFHSGTSRAFAAEKTWFDYNTEKVSCVSFDFQNNLSLYSFLFLLLNGYYILGITWMIIEHKSINLSRSNRKLLVLLASYLSVNFLFTITASVNLLRYQYVPMFMLFVVITVISEKISVTLYKKVSPAFS